MGLKAWLLAALLAWGLVSWWQDRPVPSGPVAGEPVQELVADLPVRMVGQFRLQPFARFELRARVLATTRYRLGKEADLAPVDLALGWNRMSESAVIDRLEFSQSNRFFFYRWGAEGPPLAPEEMVASAANMHLIAATPAVQRQLDALRVGARIALKGQLVDVSTDAGWRWASSRTRTDTGRGACELVWVESVTVLPPM